MIIVDHSSDMRRLYIWCAAYHAATTMQYNIGWGAHGLCGHGDGKAYDAADHKWDGELKQNPIGRNVLRDRWQITILCRNRNRHTQWKTYRCAEFDRTFGCNSEASVHPHIIVEPPGSKIP